IASAAADVHLLGLHAEPLGPRRGPAARSSPHQPRARAAPAKSRRRPQNPRRGRRQRSRAGLGGVEVALINSLRKPYPRERSKSEHRSWLAKGQWPTSVVI